MPPPQWPTNSAVVVDNIQPIYTDPASTAMTAVSVGYRVRLPDGTMVQRTPLLLAVNSTAHAVQGQITAAIAAVANQEGIGT